jgi:hypothetical protein
MVWAKFAREAGFGEAYLRNVENGNRTITLDVATAYDRVLRTGGVFAATVEATDTAAVANAPWDQGGTLAVVAELLDGSRVDRRGLLTAGFALSASASNWSRALESIGSQLAPGPLPVDPAALRHIDKRLDFLRHLDDELGSGEVYTLARGELLFAVTLIKSRRHTGTTLQHLYSLAAEAARQVAWAAFDQDRFGVATRFFDASLRASAEAGDSIAGAYTLSFAAIQCYSTPQQAGRAVSLLEAARTEVKGRGTPRMEAMLAARTARALSKTGAKKECAHQLHLARAALDKVRRDRDDRWLGRPGTVGPCRGRAPFRSRHAGVISRR